MKSKIVFIQTSLKFNNQRKLQNDCIYSKNSACVCTAIQKRILNKTLQTGKISQTKCTSSIINKKFGFEENVKKHHSAKFLRRSIYAIMA